MRILVVLYITEEIFAGKCVDVSELPMLLSTNTDACCFRTEVLLVSIADGSFFAL